MKTISFWLVLAFIIPAVMLFIVWAYQTDKANAERKHKEWEARPWTYQFEISGSKAVLCLGDKFMIHSVTWDHDHHVGTYFLAPVQ